MASSERAATPSRLLKSTPLHLAVEETRFVAAAATERDAMSRRDLRMTSFRESMKDLFKSEWKEVSLKRVPTMAHLVSDDADDVAKAAPAVAAAPQVIAPPAAAAPAAKGTDVGAHRDESDEGNADTARQHFSLRLGALFERQFEALFEIYLHYAKVDLAEDGDAAASELYLMTESKWKTCLRDATLMGTDGKTQLTTSAISNIFTNINQRRDTLAKKKATEREEGSRGKNTMVATRTAVTDAVTKVAHKGDKVRSSAVYAGGSVHGFTFSEFLEGLVVVATELPAPAGSRMGPNGLTAQYVLSAVASMLEQRVVKHAKSTDVRVRSCFHPCSCQSGGNDTSAAMPSIMLARLSYPSEACTVASPSLSPRMMDYPLVRRPLLYCDCTGPALAPAAP